MSNESGLFPAGRAVLIQPYETKAIDTIIEIPDSVREKDRMIEQRAVVIAVGPSAWCDEPAPRAKIGDKVLVAKFAGYMATGPLDGKPYRLVNDRDIFALIVDKKETTDDY